MATGQSPKLDGRISIVTGAGAGLGKSIALELARAGAGVAVVGANILDPSQTSVELDTVVSSIEKLGGEALSIPTDCRVTEQVANMVQRTIDKFGRVDILVNNVGGAFFCDFLKLSEGGWDALVRNNLKTVFLCIKAVVPTMVKQKKGSIINISSVIGLHGGTGRAPYGAAKAGVINLTKSLAVELALHGIRVNCIAPGFIMTEGIRRVRTHENLAALAKEVPLQRFGRPEDVAALAVYLASDASEYITGQTIAVDGGMEVSLARY